MHIRCLMKPCRFDVVDKKLKSFLEIKAVKKQPMSRRSSSSRSFAPALAILPIMSVIFERGLTYNQSIGKAAEKFVCDHIPCEECGHKNWMDLNNIKKNHPVTDFECLECGSRINVKGREWSKYEKDYYNNSGFPITKLSVGESWEKVKMQCNETLYNALSNPANRGKIRYYGVVYLKVRGIYKVHSVAVTEPLSKRNIDAGGCAIIARDTKWYEYSA